MTANSIDRQRYTIDDLLSMPDDGKRYELINGEIVEVGTSNEKHSTLGAWLIGMIFMHLQATKIRGRLKGSDGTYQLNASTLKAPDISYLTADSTAKVPRDAVYCPFGPDFAIEIKSPFNSQKYMQWQAELYITARTQLVWTIDLVNQTVIVYRASGDTATEYSGNIALDASDVIPGFKIDLAEMFAQIEGV